MSKPHQRVFAGIAAILFLATAVAGGVAVVWQIKKDNDQAKTSQALQDILKKQQQPPQEGKLIGTQLSNFTPVAKVDQLQKIDLQDGTGDTVKPGDTVTANYTGAVAATGTIFDAAVDHGGPQSFSLSGVIKGWTDGVPGMKVGGKRRLLIPADQAYGANPPAGSNIPPNADLVFDIELVKIGQ